MKESSWFLWKKQGSEKNPHYYLQIRVAFPKWP